MVPAVWDGGGVRTRRMESCLVMRMFLSRTHSGLTAVVRARQVLSAVTVKLSHVDWYRTVSQ